MNNELRKARRELARQINRQELEVRRLEHPERWVSCEYAGATQHRSRVLTGSIGLEGPWSEWLNGKPIDFFGNRQYQYRRWERQNRKAGGK